MVHITAAVMVSLIYIAAVNCKMDGIKSSYTMPKVCSGQTYCAHPGNDYPSEATIVKILTKNGLYNVLRNTIHIANRVGNADYSEVEAKSETMRLYYVVDVQNITRAVLQSDNTKLYYGQTNEITRCKKEGRVLETKHLYQNELENLNVKIFCYDQYAEFDFHVFSSTAPLNIESVKAKVPVFCNCRYEKNIKSI